VNDELRRTTAGDVTTAAPARGATNALAAAVQKN
jgi:hypothetical protein